MEVSEDEKKNQIALSLIGGWGFSKAANELLQVEFKDLIISLSGKRY